MFRTAMTELCRWKEKGNRKPLILKGARQIFDQDYDIPRILRMINIESEVAITPEDTPFYYSVSSHNEIDFMLQKNGMIIPVEIKAEENLKAKSLKAYCEKCAPAYAVRISMANYKEQGWIMNLPLYAIRNL